MRKIDAFLIFILILLSVNIAFAQYSYGDAQCPSTDDQIANCQKAGQSYETTYDKDGCTVITCVAGTAACKPSSCQDQRRICGSWSDGCGGLVNCGTCSQGLTCDADGRRCLGTAACKPSSCQDQRRICGSWSDGCGGLVNCGTCSQGLTCDADGRRCLGTAAQKETQSVTCTKTVQDRCVQILCSDGYRFNSCSACLVRAEERSEQVPALPGVQAIQQPGIIGFIRGLFGGGAAQEVPAEAITPPTGPPLFLNVTVIVQVRTPCGIDVLNAPAEIGLSLRKEGEETQNAILRQVRTDSFTGRIKRVDWYQGNMQLTPGEYVRSFYRANFRGRLWGFNEYLNTRECAEGVRRYLGRALTSSDVDMAPALGYDSPGIYVLRPDQRLLVIRSTVYPGDRTPDLPSSAALPTPTPIQT